MPLSYLHADGHKQAVTHIRESWQFKWIYTLQGKPDQRVTRIPHLVRIWLLIIRISHSLCIATFREVINSVGQSHCSRPNPQHDGWPIRGFVLSFSPKATIEPVGVKPPSVYDSLLGLPGPYLRHKISTFNTCSRGSTHRSLIDTDGGYNLGGAGFPHHTPQPSQPTVLCFPLNGPVWSQINHNQHKPLVIKRRSTYRRPMAFRPLDIY
jgi:hypothetical protein